MNVHYAVRGFQSLVMFENERAEVLNADFSYINNKTWQLNQLALIAYQSGYKDFSLETFKIASDLLSKPYDFYQCLDFLKALYQTDFDTLANEYGMILYVLSDGNHEDLTDRLLFKLKLFELSGIELSEKLSNDILFVLFNNEGEYRINRSLSESMPFYLLYLIKKDSFEIVKGILFEFKEYLIEIIELVLMANGESDFPIPLKGFLSEFCEINAPGDIGKEKHKELKLLVAKL